MSQQVTLQLRQMYSDVPITQFDVSSQLITDYNVTGCRLAFEDEGEIWVY